MEAADELSDAQAEELRADLRALQQELSELVASSAENAKPVDLDLPIGRLSRVDAMQQQRMLAASRQAARLRLSQVSAALTRCDAGELGLCQICGEGISFRRLKARPEAALCIRCQGQRESRGPG